VSGLEHVMLFLVANLFPAFSGAAPALIFPGLPFAVALATHKVASVALGIGATIRHLREELLERRMVMPVLAFGLPGVIVGASVILSVPERAAAYTMILVGVFWNGTGALTLGLPGESAGPGCRPCCWVLCSAAILVRIWRSDRATAGSSVPLNW